MAITIASLKTQEDILEEEKKEPSPPVQMPISPHTKQKSMTDQETEKLLPEKKLEKKKSVEQ